jgi:hypothetical protein
MTRLRYTFMMILPVALLSMLLHWAIGWEATLLAGVAGGMVSSRGHWLVGAAGVAVGWAVFVVYTAATAPPAFRILLDTVGALVGNIPGEAVVGLTVLLGALLGGLGGAMGRLFHLLLRNGEA